MQANTWTWADNILRVFSIWNHKETNLLILMVAWYKRMLNKMLNHPTKKVLQIFLLLNQYTIETSLISCIDYINMTMMQSSASYDDFSFLSLWCLFYAADPSCWLMGGTTPRVSQPVMLADLCSGAHKYGDTTQVAHKYGDTTTVGTHKSGETAQVAHKCGGTAQVAHKYGDTAQLAHKCGDTAQVAHKYGTKLRQLINTATQLR